MSSILNALRKLEHPTPQVCNDSWSGQIDHKATVTNRAKKSWQARRFLGLAVVIFGLVLAGGLAMIQKGLIHPTDSATKSSDVRSQGFPSSPSSQPRPHPLSSPSSGPESVRQAAKIEMHQPSLPSYDPKTAATETAQLKRKPVPPTGYQQRPPAPVRQPKPKVVAPQPEPKVETLPKAPHSLSVTSAQSGTAQSRPSLNRLTRSDLKLQAIAWSNDLSRRMVVISGRLLREGEGVDGFVIREIRKDHVLLDDGKEIRQLLFERRD